MNALIQLSNLQSRFSQLDRKLTLKEGEHTAILQHKQQLEKQIDDHRHNIVLSEKVGIVVQKLTELSRKETLDKVAAIVTTALQDVKDPNLSFKINYKIERGQSVAEFVIYNSKLGQEMGIMESCGGTIADIVEFALKVSLLLKWQPQLAKIFILDEAFKHVSPEDRPKLANFVKLLSEKLELQIILVSHSPEVTQDAHKVFYVTHDGTKSEVNGV